MKKNNNTNTNIEAIENKKENKKKLIRTGCLIFTGLAATLLVDLAIKRKIAKSMAESAIDLAKETDEEIEEETTEETTE